MTKTINKITNKLIAKTVNKSRNKFTTSVDLTCIGSFAFGVIVIVI